MAAMVKNLTKKINKSPPSLNLVVSVAVLAIKMLAYFITGSISLFSDAAESTVNVLAALIALLAIRIAAKPADLNHPFGHSKAENFSAMVEGILITIAAFSIAYQALPKLMNPQSVANLGFGSLISISAALINAVLAMYILRTSRGSPALIASGYHLLTDVVTSIGVLVGLGLAFLTSWWILDPILAFVVAINIIWIGWRLVRKSGGVLMDEGLKQSELNEIKLLLDTHMQNAIEIHDLKARRAGTQIFIEFHLVVPSEMTVLIAHGIADRLEEVLKQRMAATTVIHIEPADEAKNLFN